MKNLSKVKAHVLSDGKIKVIKFENFLSFIQIRAKYGSEVMRLYWKTNYICPISDHAIFIAKTGNYIRTGELYLKEDFNQIISDMKEAGKNLVSSIKKSKEIKEINIEI